MTDFKQLKPRDFRDPDLIKIKGLYQELLDRFLDADNFLEFLADFEALDGAVDEAATLARVAFDSDTTNLENGRRRELWEVEIEPQMGEIEHAVIGKILAVGIVPPGSEVAFAQWRAAQKLFRPESMELVARESELEAQYDSLVGSATLVAGGVEMTLDAASKTQLSPDRVLREEGWRATQEVIKSLRPSLEKIWEELWTIRQQLAKNAGFDNFRDYFFAYDPTKSYAPEDCANFYQAIAVAGRPVLAKVRELRRQQLGLDKLRPWDQMVDVFGRSAMDLGAGSEQIFRLAKAALEKVHPEVAAVLGKMQRAGRLDLDNRVGKTPGAYQNVLAHSKEPLIFMNAVGTTTDLQTLVHEVGHAYHSVLSLRALAYSWEVHTDAEMAEVASIALELMSYEHLTEIGVDEVTAGRMRLEQLEDILTFFAHCTTIDQLQHSLYMRADGGQMKVADAVYLEKTNGVGVGVDWTGLEEYEAARWHVQGHVWTTPFYFIEYGIAQLASLNLWKQYVQDKAGTFARYQEALKLGNTEDLAKLYAAVGSPLEFKAEYIKPIMEAAFGRYEKLIASQQPKPQKSFDNKNAPRLAKKGLAR